MGRFKRRLVPLYFYRLKDLAKRTVANPNFHDSLATSFTFVSLNLAFPFYPTLLVAILLAVVFSLTFLIPLLGLIGLLLLTLPMIIYQAPLLAWILMMIISISFILGYKHYRSITYAYALTALPLSYLGAVLEIPGLIIAILILGFKRAAVMGIVVAFLVILLSTLGNIPVSGPMAYNSSLGHQKVQGLPYAQYLTVFKPQTTLDSFQAAAGAAFSTLMFNRAVTDHLFDGFATAGVALTNQLPYTMLQILVWLFVAFSVSNYAIKSRSAYKGAIASLFGAVIPVSSFFFSGLTGVSFNSLTIFSFLITPPLIFALETLDVNVVQALDVMKQDILGKFGVAFQDLTKGSQETLNDIADYEETKQELKEAILAPIEHREIAGAYKVNPAKGILLFGPPGTGKTLIMRALANEIHAGFFYVSTSSLISPYPGESAQALSKIFATAKKHAPCVLFFDEIDSIAGRREQQGSSSGFELISALLTEMDGFKKIADVVIVGATNVPQLIDPAILRPGRFDKVLYMPLPDQVGRAKVFEHYLKDLPIGREVDFDKLASLTSRFSAADIKNVCEEVSRQIGEQAVKKREVLVIKMADIVRVLKTTKPSTSLAQLESYNTFRVDYERRAHPELQSEIEKKVGLKDVIDLEEAKNALKDAIEMPILHPELLKKYDISNIKGILMFGPPGTGKTMLMQAVANDTSDVRVLTISGYDIAKYGADRASATVKEIFDRAKENAPAIVFIDEIDAIVPSRDNAKESELQFVGEFLQQFDKIKENTSVVIVAATNRPDVLDPAMLRPGRFDRLVFVPPPDEESRAQIFEGNLEKVPIAEDIDFKRLAQATKGFTGADIANICTQAKLSTLESSLSTGREARLALNTLMDLVLKSRPSAPDAIMSRYTAFLGKYGKR